MLGTDTSEKVERARRNRRALGTAGVLLIVALVLVACGQAATSADAPTQPVAEAPASVPASQEPAAAPTSAPSQEPATAPTSGPSQEPAAATPEDTSVPVANPTPAPSAPAGGGNPTVAVGEAEVELEDFQFVPKILTVKAGTRVKFGNKDRAGHTVTSDTGLFDSGLFQKGEEWYYTFTQAGEYPYYCAPHGGPGGQGMSGTIIVVP